MLLEATVTLRSDTGLRAWVSWALGSGCDAFRGGVLSGRLGTAERITAPGPEQAFSDYLLANTELEWSGDF